MGWKERVLWVMMVCTIMLLGATLDRWICSWIASPAPRPRCETVEVTYL